MNGATRRSLVLVGLIAVMLAALYVYPLMVGMALLDPDEGFHAAVAQEMVERGDWVTPRFLGHAFWDKPILFFWAQACSLSLFGMSEGAVRLPGLLFGLMGVATTAAVAWRLFGRSTGVLAGVFQATTLVPLAVSQAPVHDVAVVPFTNLALLAFWEQTRASGRRAWWLATLATGLALGVACLAKGLLGVALVGVAYGLFLLATRQLTLRAIGGGIAALIVAACVAAPWYTMMSLRNPGYAYYFFVERHLFGFLTPSQRHGDQPWWYYLPMLLGGALPWVSYLPAALRDWWMRRAGADAQRAAVTFVLLWLLGGTLFLSTAHSKLVTYLLPVFPAVTILAAQLWVRFSQGLVMPPVAGMVTMVLRSTCIFGPLLMPISLLVAARRFDLSFSWPMIALICLVACSGAAPLWRWQPHTLARTFVLGAGNLTLAFLFVITVLAPPFAELNSAKGLSQYLNSLPAMPPRVQIADERIGSVVFYLEPRLRRELTVDCFEDLRISQWGQEASPPEGSLLAIPVRRLNRAEKVFDLARADFVTAGHYRVYRADALATLKRVEATTAQKSSPGLRAKQTYTH